MERFRSIYIWQVVHMLLLLGFSFMKHIYTWGYAIYLIKITL